jgi:divalent metal cation (Fe/Co/Zn/Cd) transporter
MDTRLPANEEAIVMLSISEHDMELVNFHRLRTRKSGQQRLIDLHMVVPSNASVEEAHRLANHLEQDIKEKLYPAQVIIHIEPCDGNCDECPLPTVRCRERYGL